MPKLPMMAGGLAIGIAVAQPALAQRVPFERSFAVNAPVIVDAETGQGKIEIVAGERGRVVVRGAATVRVGWNVPANAADLARQVAADPPIAQQGGTVTLRDPANSTIRRAVVINYVVEVPRETEIKASSDSGATSVRGVAGSVRVRTQSAAIETSDLGGAATLTTGSGAISASRIAGAVTVETSSSAFTGRGLGSSLRVSTQSGAVDAELTGTGDADVETASSAIRVIGLRGRLTAKTQSGKIVVSGTPRGEWKATTSSGAVDVGVAHGTALTIDANSRSGSVVVEQMRVEGSVDKRAVKGTVNGGGAGLRISTGSGAIRVKPIGS